MTLLIFALYKESDGIRYPIRIEQHMFKWDVDILRKSMHLSMYLTPCCWQSMYLPLLRFPVEFMFPIYFILWKAINRIGRSHRYSLADSLLSACLVGKKVKCLISCSLLCDQHIYTHGTYTVPRRRRQNVFVQETFVDKHFLLNRDFEKRDCSFILNCFRLSFSIIDQ